MAFMPTVKASVVEKICCDLKDINGRVFKLPDYDQKENQKNYVFYPVAHPSTNSFKPGLTNHCVASYHTLVRI